MCGWHAWHHIHVASLVPDPSSIWSQKNINANIKTQRGLRKGLGKWNVAKARMLQLVKIALCHDKSVVCKYVWSMNNVIMTVTH